MLNQSKILVLEPVHFQHRCIVLFLLITHLLYTNILHAKGIQEKTVTIDMFEYPPFISKSLPNNGLLGEIISKAYGQSGYHVTYNYYPLKRSTRYVISGKSLATVGGPFQFSADTHSEIESITISYIRVPIFYLKDRAQPPQLSSLKSLRGHSISALLGGGDVEVLQRDPQLRIETVATMEQLFKKLEVGRTQYATLVDLSILTYLAGHEENWQQRWVISEDIIIGTPIGLYFSKNYPDYKRYQQAFKQGFDKLRESGDYKKIMERYYGSTLVKKAINLTEPPYIIPVE